MRKLLFLITSLFYCLSQGQEIKIEKAEYIAFNDQYEAEKTIGVKYIICNEHEECDIFLLFSKANISTTSIEVALKETMMRRVNDFSLSMLAWDNIIINNRAMLVPHTFVKQIKPGETFEVIFEMKEKSDLSLELIKDYMLVLSENYLLSSSFRSFIDGIRSNGYSYPFQFVNIKSDDFLRFLGESKWIKTER